MTVEAADLDRIARQVRGAVVRMSHRGRAPHLASALSTVDVLVALYWRVMRIDSSRPEDPDRDRFLLSKGHAATALYATLAARSFFSEDLLQTYTEPGGKLAEHPSPHCVPGVEAATGSLGHGLPIGVGMAHAAKLCDRPYRVFALLSDGECNEGSVWEAAMMAPALSLDNLVVIVDFNRWQATARSAEVLALEPLPAKWEAFGWSTVEVDGHDHETLVEVLDAVPAERGKPTAIIAHTTKGKGVSFMEDDNNWHYRVPDADELLEAHRELGLVGA